MQYPPCARNESTARGRSKSFLQVSPSSTRDDERGQFASLAAQAAQALLAHGLGPANIVCGWIHFAKTPQWDWRQALTTAWEATGPLPISAIVQPPAAPFCLCTLQLHAIRSARQSGVWYGNSDKPAAATILRAGARHLRLMSITPRADLRGSADLVDMTYDMLAQAGHALTDRGLASRTSCERGSTCATSSTTTASSTRLATASLPNRAWCPPAGQHLRRGRFVWGRRARGHGSVRGGRQGDVAVEAIAPGPMGEASAYGSAFARGSQIVEPGRKTLYISGTASIDASGAVVAVGDITGQLDCMFDNVRRCLPRRGWIFATWSAPRPTSSAADDLRDFLEGSGCPRPFRRNAHRGRGGRHLPARMAVRDRGVRGANRRQIRKIGLKCSDTPRPQC
jgi:hypothetical protein